MHICRPTQKTPTKFQKDTGRIAGVVLIRVPLYIPDKKRNAPLRTVQLSGRSQVIGQFSLYQYKGMSGTAVSHVFCNPASKLC